mmetsp:Transcript_34710/g.85409  ORF Transcript_34710/g.85409 Transcript_34710/m.85409 type:complete len:90 (-) Transcript_34710:486-755(-)
MFDDIRRFIQSLDGSSSEAAATADASSKTDPSHGANEATGSGPATHFRDAASQDGVTVWGPIMGGVVAVGGGVAIVGSLLAQKPASHSA